MIVTGHHQQETNQTKKNTVQKTVIQDGFEENICEKYTKTWCGTAIVLN